MFQAAITYNNLLKHGTHYIMILGHKKKETKLDVRFSESEFYHLAGIQHLDDFSYPKTKSSLFLQEILNDPLLSERVMKSKNIGLIKDRLKILSKFNGMFDEQSEMFVWNISLARFHTNITANYILQRTVHNYDELVFIRSSKKSTDDYCVSIVTDTTNKYTSLQIKFTVLRIEEISDGLSRILFEHHSYTKRHG